LMVFGLYVLLRRRWVPPFLKYAVTAADLLLISTVLVLGGEPHSTLPALYFLVIVAAGLRLSLPLVYATTLGAMACYAVYLGYVRWGLELSDSQRLARPQQIVFLLALGGAGLLVGQSVRQVRRILMRQVTVIDQREEASA
ncbi:MAG TPA: hypothetical protein VE988_12095, partial [Gemmataceae bacterium]|nr:hypothetical protein [Gemmataceae bacterium]